MKLVHTGSGIGDHMKNQSHVPNHNLAILHLPRPIEPKEGEDYWRIGKAADSKLVG